MQIHRQINIYSTSDSYAEMKMPCEAWLEFKIIGYEIQQTAVFRPLGIAGSLY